MPPFTSAMQRFVTERALHEKHRLRPAGCGPQRGSRVAEATADRAA